MIGSFIKKLGSGSNDDGSVNIVCIGDSVTQGCFGACGINGHTYGVQDGYCRKLQSILESLFPGRVINVINSGIGGRTAAHAVTRFDRDVLAYHPDLVVICFGVNDFGDRQLYLDSLATMFDRLGALNIPCIYMTQHMMNTRGGVDGVTERYRDYSMQTAEVQNNGTMDAMFEGGKAVAKEKGVYICDVYSKWKKLSESGVDVTALLANRINHPVGELHDLFAWSIVETALFAE